MTNGGEHIDTTRHAGTNPANTAAWSSWASRHLPEMRTIQAAGILGPENRDWRNIGEHLLAVNGTATLVAQELAKSGVSIDLKLVDQASILHDATKRLEREQGVSYATEHGSSIRGDFLESQGYAPEVIEATGYTGRVKEMWIEDPEEQGQAIEATPLEHLVLAYADARVRNTDVVSLEEARDLNKRKVPADAEVYDQWYSFYKNVEETIFGQMESGFRPEDLTNESVTQMVADAA